MLKTKTRKVTLKVYSTTLIALLLVSLMPAGIITALADDEILPLKDVYKDYFLVGNVVSPNDLNTGNAAKYEFMKYHFNAMTAENNMKPSNLWANETTGPNFTTADNMMSQVKADGFLIHGHTLAWHSQSPNWVNTGLTYEQAKANLQKYISAVAGHYALDPVKVISWDVVNEAMQDNPSNPTDWHNALRSGTAPSSGVSKWFGCYANGGNGWDYIYDAFLFAREADPDATLYYNDYNDENPNKSIAITSMVIDVNNRYANEHPEANGRKLIEGVGMQGHYSTGVNLNNVEAAIQRIIAAGAKITVSELDVTISGVSSAGPTPAQEKTQAEVYAKLFLLYMKYSGHIERVTFWGTDDGTSWRSSQFPQPFNADRSPKEAYFAIKDPVGYLGIEAPAVTGLEVSDKELSLDIGHSKNITVQALLADGEKEDVTTAATYTSSNNAVCTAVNGLITAVGFGKATVTVRYMGLHGELVSEEITVSSELLPLKDIYKDYFLVGTVVSPNDLNTNNSEKYEFMKFHFNALTAENHMKPINLWPSEANPSFTTADNMITRVKTDDFFVHGHTLAWHSQSPNWLNTNLTYEQAKANLKRYISTVAGHYAEDPVKVISWDVVNEAFRDSPSNPTDWRNALRTGTNPTGGVSKWFGCYANGGNGWDYMYDAFLFAREADPDATLYYNDYNDENPNKSIAITSMVVELNERYANEHPEANGRKLIEGVGMQGHYSTGVNLSNVEAAIKRIIAAGVKITVSELDVTISGVSSAGPTPAQERTQALVYARLFQLYKKYSEHIERVTFWGVDDGNSWRGTQFPLLFNANRSPKEAYFAVKDPVAYLGEEVVTMESFTYGGETFNVTGNQTEFDVNVSKATSIVDFSDADIIATYPNDINLSITLTPFNGVVTADAPCKATIVITAKEHPEISKTYIVWFGQMMVGKISNNNNMWFDSNANVRFSDGETSFKIIQAFYKDGRLVKNYLTEKTPIPRHSSGDISGSTMEEFNIDGLTVKVFLWDQNYVPLVKEYDSSVLVETEVWKSAKTIEAGKSYVIVSANNSIALTNASANIPAGNGVSYGQSGRASTVVSIQGDYIEDEVIRDNMIWDISTADTHPAPGPFTGQTGFYIRNGAGTSNYLQRGSSNSQPTAPLSIGALPSNTHMAIWFFGTPDATGLTNACLYSVNDTSNHWVFALFGNSSGFVGEGGNIVTGEDPRPYQNAAPLRLYEKVIEMRPAS